MTYRYTPVVQTPEDEAQEAREEAAREQLMEDHEAGKHGPTWEQVEVGCPLCEW